MPTHHTLSPDPSTVHWGYLDAKIPPRLTIESGDTVTIETVSGGLADVGDTSIMLRRTIARYARSSSPRRGRIS
jgi:acetamidase/formamidase